MAFSAYPRPVSLEASPNRDAASILATLTAAPLRKLSGEQIGPYAGWALTTVGSASDYKHFLPRILEQAVRRDVWLGTAPPIIVQRLLRADWSDSPASERTAVRDVFVEAFGQACSEHPDFGADASDWLCALAALGVDVSVLLSRWLTFATPNAALQIAEFARRGGELTWFAADDLAYWTYVDERVRRRVAEWMFSTPVRATLQTALGSAARQDRWRLERALEMLNSGN